MVQKNLNDSQQPADIEFQSGDLKCRAYLYRTDQSTASPIIVMAHGLGGTRKMRLTAFAERFVKEGYACLVFDYRYYGDSDGKPRQLLDIQCQLEDWKAAIRYARSLPNIDASHIVLWGSSFSGGHVLATAAQDANICAVISQCPFTDGLASSMAMNPITSSKLTALAIRDRIGATLGQKTVMVKLAGHPNETALMTAPDDYAGIIPDYKNYVAARFALDIIRYYPGRKTSKIKAPVLFCICENDTVAPAKTTLRHANRTPQKELKTYSYGHFEIYTGDAFEHVVKDQIDFLKRHVSVHYA